MKMQVTLYLLLVPNPPMASHLTQDFQTGPCDPTPTPWDSAPWPPFSNTPGVLSIAPATPLAPLMSRNGPSPDSYMAYPLHSKCHLSTEVFSGYPVEDCATASATGLLSSSPALL